MNAVFANDGQPPRGSPNDPLLGTETPGATANRNLNVHTASFASITQCTLAKYFCTMFYSASISQQILLWEYYCTVITPSITPSISGQVLGRLANRESESVAIWPSDGEAQNIL